MRAFRLILALAFFLVLDPACPLTPQSAEGVEEAEEAVHLVPKRSLGRPARESGPSSLPRVSDRAAHQEPSRIALNLAHSGRSPRAPAVEVRKWPPPQSESASSPEDH